jgi:hypothetical protein
VTPTVVVIAAVFWTRASPGGFTVSEAFVALSVVALVSPVANFMGSYPTFVSPLACFERIQKILLSDEQEDERLIGFPPPSDYKTSSSDFTPAVGTRCTRNLMVRILKCNNSHPETLLGQWTMSV